MNTIPIREDAVRTLLGALLRSSEVQLYLYLKGELDKAEGSQCLSDNQEEASVGAPV